CDDRGQHRERHSLQTRLQPRADGEALHEPIAADARAIGHGQHAEKGQQGDGVEPQASDLTMSAAAAVPARPPAKMYQTPGTSFQTRSATAALTAMGSRRRWCFHRPKRITRKTAAKAKSNP